MKKINYINLIFCLFIILGVYISNSNIIYAANIGDRITEPEEGWRRYDDSNENIEYIGDVIIKVDPTHGYYNDDLHSFDYTDASVKFSFYGTKLRLYEHMWSNRRTNNRISFDGGKTFETFSACGNDPALA